MTLQLIGRATTLCGRSQCCVVDHNVLYFPNDPLIWIELYKINMDVMEFLFDAVFCIIKQNIVTF